MISDTTVGALGKKIVSMKTAGHKKYGVTVRLAAKDEAKELHNLIVIKESNHDIEKLKKKY